MTKPAAPGRLRWLMDTNVCIALEPFGGDLEVGLGSAARMLRLLNEQGHRVFVHPATRDDLLEGQDDLRRSQRLAELDKFEMLDEGPISSALEAAAGRSEPGTNDHRDLRILAALESHAVHYLITDDRRLRRRASRAGLGDAVMTVLEAVTHLVSLQPRVLPPPPRVERLKTYSLDTEQTIFSSLRRDYPDFGSWLDRVRADSDNRDCLVVQDENGQYAALALMKPRELDCVYDFSQPVVKISTFKVSDDHAGSRYGELLLKALFGSAYTQTAESIYVEVLPKHQALIDFMADFGFTASGYQTSRGEEVLRKRRAPSAKPKPLSALDYHIEPFPVADRQGR